MELLVKQELAEPPPRAPPDEPGTSADEGDAEDADAHPALYQPQPGAFAVLHSLSTAYLNGRIAVVREKCRGGQGEQRWRVWLTPEGWLDADQATKSIMPANLAVVAPREWADVGDTHDRECVESTARHVLDNFVASGAARVEFPPELSGKTRSRLHGCCKDVNKEVGFDLLGSVTAKATGRLVVTADRGSRDDAPTSYLLVPVASASTSAPLASDDLGTIRFDEVCELLERLEAIPDCDSLGGTIKGAAERRKQRAAQFWSSPHARPRHTRPNLFSVVRLLLPFHDLRRYYGMVSKRVATCRAISGPLGRVVLHLKA